MTGASEIEREPAVHTQAAPPALRRDLGLLDAVGIGFGAIVGARAQGRGQLDSLRVLVKRRAVRRY